MPGYYRLAHLSTEDMRACFIIGNDRLGDYGTLECEITDLLDEDGDPILEGFENEDADPAHAVVKLHDNAWTTVHFDDLTCVSSLVLH